jgi:DNA (cytosine-5)-methyltransferase 1
MCGKRSATDPRASLYEDYLDVVRMLHPLAVAMENVPGILTMARPDGTPVMAWIGAAFRRLGYAVGYRRLMAADHGVPQARERVFILAWRVGGAPRIEPTHDRGGGNGLPAWRTLRDAVEGLPESPKDFLQFPEGRLRFLRMLRAGQDWRDLPAGLQAEAMGKSIDGDGGMTGYYRRLSWDRPSPTLTCCPTGKSTSLCHPDKDRPLSVQECQRIQQFPDDYVLCGSVADRYAQLGNAVPVGLARAVAAAVRGALPGDPGETVPRRNGGSGTCGRDSRARVSPHVVE